MLKKRADMADKALISHGAKFVFQFLVNAKCVYVHIQICMDILYMNVSIITFICITFVPRSQIESKTIIGNVYVQIGTTYLL